ncbi:hypothetical protein [Mycoplasma sp. 21DD0573]|uniref:hypothetical protein n=1 Tax=unclassified Mycoplasma TaxID=2683645 RepID=UPI002B1D5921|nr:hypothetical protein [Mycoplasma sp. 21DD0573]MEA4276449.1 hypothetical protein [Mycoplasma sp. 21DD0573]
MVSTIATASVGGVSAIAATAIPLKTKVKKIDYNAFLSSEDTWLSTNDTGEEYLHANNSGTITGFGKINYTALVETTKNIQNLTIPIRDDKYKTYVFPSDSKSVTINLVNPAQNYDYSKHNRFPQFLKRNDNQSGILLAFNISKTKITHNLKVSLEWPAVDYGCGLNRDELNQFLKETGMDIEDIRLFLTDFFDMKVLLSENEQYNNEWVSNHEWNTSKGIDTNIETVKIPDHIVANNKKFYVQLIGKLKTPHKALEKYKYEKGLWIALYLMKIRVVIAGENDKANTEYLDDEYEYEYDEEEEEDR